MSKNDLGQLVEDMPVRWCLERVSVDKWCVFNAETGETISGESTAEKAIYNALYKKPLTPTQQKYHPRYAWNHICEQNKDTCIGCGGTGQMIIESEECYVCDGKG